MIKNKKILITGIYGFLGKHLAIKLHDNNEIIGINLPNKSKNLQKELDNITIIEGDVSENNTLENNQNEDFHFWNLHWVVHYVFFHFLQLFCFFL